MLEVLEHQMGLEIEGEDPQDILTEISRIFVDEYGIAQDVVLTQQDDTVTLEVKHCVLLQVEKDLVADGIKPFVCPFLNIAEAAMSRRLQAKTKLAQFDVQPEAHLCRLAFEIL
jgi:hypothetical protein